MSRLPETPGAGRPTTGGALIALATAVGAALAGSPGPLGTAPLVLVGCGVSLLPAGTAVGRLGHRPVGRGLSVTGVAVALAALAGAVALSPPAVLVPTLSAGVGLIALAFGLYFASGSVARTVALGGLTLVFLAVLANAVVADLPVRRPVAAVALVMVAWDAGDRAITLGRRVGTDAGTASVELPGVATTGAVAVAGVVAAVAVSRIPLGASSVTGLALLLAAALALVLALSSIPAGEE